VHDQPGTTTDPVDTPFSFEGKDFVLIDTAGMRRKARIEESTERLSVSLALGQIRRADVVALVIDATLGPSDQDAKIAGEAERSGAAIMILINKVDALGTAPETEAHLRKLREQLEDQMPFVSFAPVRTVSARTGKSVSEALGTAARIAGERARRVTTSQLNKFFSDVCETHPPPTFRGKPVRVHYMAQPATRPPTFVLWANKPELVHHAYRRFLANQLREHFGFEGTPLRIITRQKDSKQKR
jgi:GTP-binding protein